MPKSRATFYLRTNVGQNSGKSRSRISILSINLLEIVRPGRQSIEVSKQRTSVRPTILCIKSVRNSCNFEELY